MERLSFTSLKEFNKSPNHYLWYKSNKRETSGAMFKGSLVDCLILEPWEFDNRYVVFDETEILNELKEAKSPRATKVYKLWKEQVDKDAEGKSLITVDELHEAELMKASVEQVYRFQNEGSVQVQVKLEGTINGVEFIGYADEVDSTLGLVTDLKTTKDASYDQYQRSIVNFSYYLQGAIYLELSGCKNFQHVAVENKAPYNAAKYLFHPDVIAFGKKRLYELTDEFKRWQDSGKPNTGYKDQTMDLPHWYTKKFK